MKFLFNFVYYTLLLGVLAIGLLLVSSLVPVPGNIEVKIVKSGSMEPSIQTGSIVVIRPVNEYKVGDVVTFGPDTATQIPTTHRIIAEEGTGASKTFSTQGDANDAPDPIAVRPQDIAGKVIFTIPYAGYVLDFARQPVGFMLLVGVPALAIVIEELGNIIREIRRMRRSRIDREIERRNQISHALHQVPQKPQRPRVN